jgi:hypothetical protein
MQKTMKLGALVTAMLAVKTGDTAGAGQLDANNTDDKLGNSGGRPGRCQDRRR